jgi:uroporphyrin-III C-methyltransferase
VTVHLVGAGPGDADLLTLRAARLLRSADVVVHDRLIERAVLALAPRNAELIDVGKVPGGSSTQSIINDLLVSLGRRHGNVVRLKGGDPFVFGRGGEEMIALQEAGVECDVVPGVTSAFSGPLAAGIPVTHRGVARGVTVVTGHAFDDDDDYFRRIAHPELSLVILMGVARRASIARQLIQGGLAPATSVAVVENSWTQRQRVVRGTLGELGRLDVSSPAIIVVGPTAALRLGDVASEAAVRW